MLVLIPTYLRSPYLGMTVPEPKAVCRPQANPTDLLCFLKIPKLGRRQPGYYPASSASCPGLARRLSCRHFFPDCRQCSAAGRPGDPLELSSLSSGPSSQSSCFPSQAPCRQSRAERPSSCQPGGPNDQRERSGHRPEAPARPVGYSADGNRRPIAEAGPTAHPQKSPQPNG